MNVSDRKLWCGVWCVGVIFVSCLACTSPAQKQSPPPVSQTTVSESRPSLESEGPTAEHTSSGTIGAKTASPPEPLPPFPSDLPLHKPYDLAVDGDRDLRLAHAAADQKHAIVYLHGMCGDSRGADSWIDIATEQATVITVRAHVPCPDRPGYKWPQEASEIQARIEQALRRVHELRAGHLDTSVVTLIGYSQGAHRAERLAAAYPAQYRRLVLGGPPTPPEVDLLAHAEAIAILGGEFEDTAHMEFGFSNLKAAGKNARFFLLPRAHHGGYGPEGRRVMTEVLSWLWAK